MDWHLRVFLPWAPTDTSTSVTPRSASGLCAVVRQAMHPPGWRAPPSAVPASAAGLYAGSGDGVRDTKPSAPDGALRMKASAVFGCTPPTLAPPPGVTTGVASAAAFGPADASAPSMLGLCLSLAAGLSHAGGAHGAPPPALGTPPMASAARCTACATASAAFCILIMAGVSLLGAGESSAASADVAEALASCCCCPA